MTGCAFHLQQLFLAIVLEGFSPTALVTPDQLAIGFQRLYTCVESVDRRVPGQHWPVEGSPGGCEGTGHNGIIVRIRLNPAQGKICHREGDITDNGDVVGKR